MSLRGTTLPRRRGRPPKVVHTIGRGSNRLQQQRAVTVTLNSSNHADPNCNQGDSSSVQGHSSIFQDNIELGDELYRWNELKEEKLLDSDEDLAKVLLDHWETKGQKKDGNIQVGPATLRDFTNFQSKTKRSSDELIRFFLRLDVEPGQNILIHGEESAKLFESMKSNLHMSSIELMKYLYELHVKCTNQKKDEKPCNSIAKQPSITPSTVPSSLPTTAPSSMLQQTVKQALREELIQLIQDGILPSLSNSYHGNTSANSPTDNSPTKDDSTTEISKKRSRKSLPQRVVHTSLPQRVVHTSLPQRVVHTSLPQRVVHTADPANSPGLCTDDTEVMQYTYIINSSSQSQPGIVTMTTTGTMHQPTPAVSTVSNPRMTPVPQPGIIKVPSLPPPRSVSKLQPKVQLQRLSQPQPQPSTDNTIAFPKLTAAQKKATSKDLESEGLFKVGNYIVVKNEKGLLNCPYCEYTTVMITRLRRHVTLHTGKSYKCMMCDRSYTEEYKLKEHIQVKHERSVHFACKLCDRDFTSKGGLKYHTKTVHQKDFTYWCDQCSKGFNQLKLYQVHANKHNGPTQYKCNICMKEFSYLATLSMHRKSCVAVAGDKVNKLACEMCGDTFTNDKELEEHISAEHCDVSWYRCSCGVEFRWRQAFDKHKASCSESVESNSDSPPDDGLMNVAIIKVESLYKQATPRTLAFNKETDTAIKAEASFDDNSFDSVQIMNVESGEQFTCDLTGDDTSSASGTVHACQQCDYKTAKLSHMKRHALTHNGKKYKCQECTKSFGELNKLRTHQNSKHQGHARYKCDKCSRTFSSKGGIMYHQQTKHNNSFKYKCETCDKGFNTIQHYLGHKNTHTGIRPYVCDKCDLGFAYPSVLTSHRRVCKGKIEGVDRNGLDLYPCKECKEKFAMLSSLEDHMQESHSISLGNKYMCECGADFELRALYDLHKTTCTKSATSLDIILETVNESMEVDKDIPTVTDGSAITPDEGFTVLTPEKFNSILNNQPVFPT